MNRAILINDLDKDELKGLIRSEIALELTKQFSQLDISSAEEFLTRKETAEFLKVSLVTLHHWSKQGILKPYKLGSRTYYNRKKIIETINNSNP